MQEGPEESARPVDDEATAADREGREDQDEGFRRQWQPRLWLKLALLGLLVAYAIAFVLENNKHVSVHFVFASARVSLIWLVLLSVALGLLAGVLLSQLHRRRRRRK
ncbi:MAG TPA: lipopolysaccharide assembly protein LapA domain-containing protein [Gaiellaceae bacterium]